MAQPTSAAAPYRPLRLWPGWILVSAMWFLRFGLPALNPEALIVGVPTALLCGLLVFLWWLAFSRAPAADRWWVLGVGLAVPLLTIPFLHVSVATGMQGLMFPIYALPVLATVLVLWAVVTRGWDAPARRVALGLGMLAASLPWALVRTGGFTGDLDQDFAWRWSPTPEERLLAAGGAAPPTRTAAGELAQGPTAWPGFRGPGRDSRVAGTRIDPDWSASPPREVWRRAVGPAWSSFAVHGDRLFTQEQRGEEEWVACYDLATGALIWRHAEATRFWESNAGAGPRATPTYHAGRVYSLGATGILTALDAADGRLLWSRDVGQDSGTEVPEWGFASSPWVAGERVFVAAASSLEAYDLADGTPIWSGMAGDGGYSSPHGMRLAGVDQVVFLRESGAVGHRAEDGAVLWDHAWEGDPIVQPARVGDGGLLLAVSATSGLRRLDVSREGEAWSVREAWTSIRLKPYYNDFVVHGDHAYGFDVAILACVDLAQGGRSWKGGRYGYGQLLLLADQDLLLVLSESGELILVDAVPGAFAERARFAAIEGKTWNHPVLVGDLLLVRNAEEMAAFRLARLDDGAEPTDGQGR